jgi:hypothetical protein
MPFINRYIRTESRGNTPPISNNRDIELNDLARGTPPPPPPPNPENTIAPLTFKKNRPWFALLIAFTLGFTAIGLHAPYSMLEKKAEWTRKGSDEMLTHGQVLFVSVPRPEVWSRFLGFMLLQVLIMESVYRYAELAAMTNGTKANVIAWFRNLFFAVAVFLVALFMWGWLMWSI